MTTQSARQHTADLDYNNYRPGTDRSKFSETEKKPKLTDWQVLNQIDSSEDPLGKYALRKIDFSRGGMSCGRKEFSSKDEALRALELSKTRVAEIMQQQRYAHLENFR